MSEQSFFRSLSKNNRYIVGNLYFMYIIQGIFTIMIGAILPMIKEEYGLNYQVGGMLISAHSIGNVAVGLLAGVLPLYLGIKNSLMVLNSFTFIGFGMTLASGNPVWLIIALLFTGIGRGGVSNYNNSIINDLSNGHAGPLNLLHGFFAIGAFLSPFIVLICTRNGDSGWRTAVWVIIALCVVSMISCNMMKIEHNRPQSFGKGGFALGFFKEKIFWITSGIMFCLLCVQGTVDGWLVTYFVDTGTMNIANAQILNAVLWLVVLGGRIGCTILSSYFPTHKIILYSSVGVMAFFIPLILSHSPIAMSISAVGLGLCLSGMFATTVANAGEVLKKYPLAMGVFNTITGIGAVIVPILIGSIAEESGIRSGLSSVIVAVVFLLAFAIWNAVDYSSRKVIASQQCEECHL